LKVTVTPTIRDYPWGAPGHCMGALVEELLAAGHEVQWLVAPIDLDHPEVARLRQSGAHVQKLPDPLPKYVRWKELRRKLHTLCRGEKSLAETVQAFSPDHIFVNQGGTWCALEPELYEVLAGHKGRYSLICHLGQAGGFPAGESLERGAGLMVGARKVYFNSRWTKKMAEEQIGTQIQNSRFFQYPVRFAFDRPLPWPENPVVRIGMVNRIDIQHKGLDLAVEAVATLKREGLRLELTIVGRGEDDGRLRELIRQSGVEAEVKVEPYTEDLTAFWADKDLFLLPSRYEGLAVAMVEAMGFGRPVIRTPFGGTEEWMEEGVNGWVCPQANAGALAQTLRRAIQQREDWKEMGKRAHDKVKKELDSRPGRVFLESLR
jgi:glycosyltransferase involved in cell wall biosynthesis